MAGFVAGAVPPVAGNAAEWLGDRKVRNDKNLRRGKRPAELSAGRRFTCEASNDRPKFEAPSPNERPIAEQSQKPWFTLSLCALVAAVSVTAIAQVGGAFTQQLYETANDIPTELVAHQGTIYGKMISVADGDTFRLRHAPDGKSATPFKGKKSEHSISVRLAGVDSPELPHGSNPGQPFGPEARAALSKILGDQTLSVQLLRRDQYGRVVAHVTTEKGELPAAVLLREGLAVVYEGGGSVYGPGKASKDELLKVQAEAQKAKKGVWSLGGKFVSPAEYKRQARQKDD